MHCAASVSFDDPYERSFRANVLGPGSDGFNSNYDRDSVSYDDGNNNPQSAEGTGASLRLDIGLDVANRSRRRAVPGPEQRRVAQHARFFVRCVTSAHAPR